MSNGKELSSTTTLEWRVNLPEGKSEALAPESGRVGRVLGALQDVILGLIMKICRFFMRAWNIGVNEPRKVIHCLKVGMALSLVSLFYYMRPLYESVGGNAMWAVMTVVVVFEYTVGATLSKSINRATGTFLAGSLGVSVHWVASQCGERFEPIVLEASVFFLAAAATFSRFIPTVKARFDYGAMVFILTFSLVSVSGYRVEKLFQMAHHRLATIALGTSICILTSMLFFPVWAGHELHSLINRNMEKLADSLDGCVADYFKDNGILNVNEEESRKKMQGYKCVLNSKATEESMANFARWEPAHGRFNFRHPWKLYLRIGVAMRNCAYCIETLKGCINSDIQAPESLKKHFNEVCMRLSRYSSTVLKDLTITMKTMTKSSTIELSVDDMNFAVEELRDALKSLPNQLFLPQLTLDASENGKGDNITKMKVLPIMEIHPVATVASLLIEIGGRIKDIVDEVDELASHAEFKPARKKSKGNQMQTTSDNQDHETLKTLQKV